MAPLPAEHRFGAAVQVCESIQTDALESGERPTDKPLQELHLQFLRLMDALAEAGAWDGGGVPGSCWPS